MFKDSGRTLAYYQTQLAHGLDNRTGLSNYQVHNLPFPEQPVEIWQITEKVGILWTTIQNRAKHVISFLSNLEISLKNRQFVV